MRTLFIFIILFITVSCAKNTVEKTDEAIDVALTHLSSEKCDDAIKVLEDVGMQKGNAVYLQVLASAYACKAHYKELSFIVDDLTTLDASAPDAVLTSLVNMSLATETAADSGNYTNIRRGINVLLNSTSGVPSQTDRTSKFGSRKAGDMGVQALLLNLVNLGKFLHYYGNVDSSGAKGMGTNTNKCFIKYNDSRAQTVISGGAGGTCNSNNSPHPDLDQTTATGKRRLCEGLMLLTNVFDVLDNLDLSGSDDLSILEDMSSQVDSFRSAAVAAGLSTLINMTSQSACETYLNTPANLDDMEYLYSLIYETGLQ